MKGLLYNMIVFHHGRHSVWFARFIVPYFVYVMMRLHRLVFCIMRLALILSCVIIVGLLLWNGFCLSRPRMDSDCRKRKWSM
jgi:hypothetical protein